MEQDYSSSLYQTRRSYERYKLDDSAVLIINQKFEKSLILSDLCARGVGFVCDFPLKLDEKIEIIIRSSIFEGTVRKEAKVVWCNHIEGNLYRAGVDFGLDNKMEIG